MHRQASPPTRAASLALWKSLIGKKKFPVEYLCDVKQTLDAGAVPESVTTTAPMPTQLASLLDDDAEPCHARGFTPDGVKRRRRFTCWISWYATHRVPVQRLIRSPYIRLNSPDSKATELAPKFHRQKRRHVVKNEPLHRYPTRLSPWNSTCG